MCHASEGPGLVGENQGIGNYILLPRPIDPAETCHSVQVKESASVLCHAGRAPLLSNLIMPWVVLPSNGDS